MTDKTTISITAKQHKLLSRIKETLRAETSKRVSMIDALEKLVELAGGEEQWLGE